MGVYQNYARRTHRHHDPSPHLGVLKFLISIVVLICLWNVWNSVPSSSSISSNSISSIQGSQRFQHSGSIPLSRQDQDVSSTVEGSQMEGQESQAIFYPLETTVDGKNLILLKPSSRQASLARKLQHEHGFLDIVTNFSSTPTQTSSTNEKRDEKSTSGLSAATSTARQLALGHRTSPDDAGTFATIARKSFQVRNACLYAIAVSVSIIAAGFFAKRAMERWEEWELRSKEDSLAFDVAYTATFSTTDYAEYDYVSLGSLEAESDWSGDCLDRFDV